MNSSSDSSNSQFMHVRRCHICGCINEKDSVLVDRCLSCGKALAPFIFCYNGIGYSAAEELEKRLKAMDKDLASRPSYPPLIGLTLYW